MTTGGGSPVVIGPPLAGEDWVAFNACCETSAHRFSMLSTGGRVNGSERFAIDFVRYDLSVNPTSLDPGQMPTFQSDPTRNEDYLAYDEPVLAVADGTVVKVVSDMPDVEPQVLFPGLILDELGGNRVVIDIGDGVYAFSGHLATGSPTVAVGDEVTRGQVIGQLGNSGNTTEAHLHFQLSRTPAPLTGDNVPFVIDDFDFVGSVPIGGFIPGPDAGGRTDQMLLGRRRFPRRPVMPSADVSSPSGAHT